MINKEILNGISSDQFKYFLLEQFKRFIKKNYKSNLKILEDLNQKQLKIIFDNRITDQNLIVLDQKDFSEKRKQILDNGNDLIREIENLFENLTINVDNKTDYDQG